MFTTPHIKKSGTDKSNPSALFFQPKLTINQPNDQYEQEADAVADKVMRTSDASAQQTFFKPSSAPLIQPKFKEGEELQKEENKEELVLQKQPVADLPIQRNQAKYEDEEKEKISRKETAEGTPAITDKVTQTLQSSGHRMDNNTLNFMEGRFGYNFSDVQIHNDAQANQSSGDINALAYTHQNHIVFNRGQYQPGTDTGKHLLAHELTHVVQQEGKVQRFIQRAPKPKQEILTQTYGENFVIFEQELDNQPAAGLYPGMLNKGYVKIEILNLPPEKADLFNPDVIKFSPPVRNHEELPIIDGGIQLPEQDPQDFIFKPKNLDKAIVLRVTRRIDIKTSKGLEAHLSLTAQTTLSKKFQITKDTPREMVEQMFNSPFGSASISILFNHKFPGDEFADSADPVNDTRVTSLNDIIRTYAPDLVGYNFTAQQQYDAAIKLLLAYVPHAAIALDDPKRAKKEKEFKTLEDAQKEAARMGKKDILIVQTADGKFLLYELTQMDLFRIATQLRTNEGNDNSVDWRALPDKVKIEKLYIDGKETSLDEVVQNYYYVDAGASARGNGKGDSEAIIYKMRSSGFFARKPVTHAEAMAIWKTIDEKVEFAENIAKGYQLAEGQFVSLYVKGVGQYHTIGADYVEGKRMYFKNIDEYNKDITIGKSFEDSLPPLLFDIYQARGGDKLQVFIEAQLDRGAGNDDLFRQSLNDKNNLQNSLSWFALDKLDKEARNLSLDILTRTQDALTGLTGSDDALRNLILSLSKMDSKERKDVLSMMGVQEDRKDIYSSVLADPTIAAQVAFGIPVKTVSFQVLRSSMQTVLKDTSNVIKEIKNGNFAPLRAEGDFGNAIRDAVYKNNGFTKLTGSNFPHHGQTKGILPGALSGNASDFSGMMEQVYANMVAQMDTNATIFKVATITVVALVTAAIVILSGGIGAGVAAAFFEAGTAAFLATEVVVTAASMTILSEGLNQAMGQGALGKDKPYYGAGDLAWSFGENLALSSIFAGVGRIMKNAAAVWRLTATGTLFLGYSFGKYYYQNKKLPQGRDLYLFIYENLISLAAIEAGSVLARPLTQMFYAKGLDVRVERINQKITDLKTDIIGSQKKLADMVGADKIDDAAGLKLISDQRTLLERQKLILTEIRDTKELNVDYDANAELQKVNEALEKIKVTEFQRKVNFKQNSLYSNKISYKPGADAVTEIINFYGKDNVTGPDTDGRLEVKLTDGSQLSFYPEGKEADNQPPGSKGSPAAEPAIKKPAGLQVNDIALQRIVDLGLPVSDLNKIMHNAASVAAGDEIIFDLLRVMELTKRVSLSNFDKLVTGLGSSNPTDFRTTRHLLDDAASYSYASTVNGVEFKYTGLEKGDRLLGKFSLADLNTLMNLRWGDGFVNTLYDLTQTMPGIKTSELIDLANKAKTGGKGNLGRVKEIVDALKKTPVTYAEAVNAIDAVNAFGAEVTKAMKDPKTGFDGLVKLIWGEAATVEGNVIKVKDKFAGGSEIFTQVTGLGKADKLAEGILTGKNVDNAKWEVFRSVIDKSDIPPIIKNKIIGDMWGRANIKAFERQGYTVFTEIYLSAGKTQARADAVLVKGNEIIFIEFKSGDAVYSDGQEVIYPLLEKGKFKEVSITNNDPLAAKYTDPTFSIKFREVREAVSVGVR